MNAAEFANKTQGEDQVVKEFKKEQLAKTLPESLDIINMIRSFTMKEVREKIDRWKKKNPEFVKQFVLFFTK